MQAPINPVDINIIEGKYPLKPTLPAIAGVEGVAVVRDAGAEVFINAKASRSDSNPHVNIACFPTSMTS